MDKVHQTNNDVILSRVKDIDILENNIIRDESNYVQNLDKQIRLQSEPDELETFRNLAI